MTTRVAGCRSAGEVVLEMRDEIAFVETAFNGIVHTHTQSHSDTVVGCRSAGEVVLEIRDDTAFGETFFNGTVHTRFVAKNPAIFSSMRRSWREECETLP